MSIIFPRFVVKKAFALILLSLYSYNIVGYLAVFEILQYRVKKEVKALLKAGVPEAELVSIPVREGEEQILDWIDENEFRHHGSLYDVVRYYVSGDTTYYLCINDEQEEQLFANLGEHVRNHTNSHGQQGTTSIDLSLEFFKGHFKPPLYAANGQFECVAMIDVFGQACSSPTLDIPTPPPRLG